MWLTTNTAKTMTFYHTLKTFTFCGTYNFNTIAFGENINGNRFTYIFIWFAIAYFFYYFFRSCISFGDKKEKHSLKSEIAHFAKANTAPKKIVKEIRNSESDKNVGETITTDIFAEGDNIEVVGTTKGKGFQGVVKRHGFSGVGGQSHGQHDRSRAPGSIGNSSDASRVFKGMRMGGRMGGERVKMKGLKVVKIFAEKNYILVSGSVPGHIGSIVLIQK